MQNKAKGQQMKIPTQRGRALMQNKAKGQQMKIHTQRGEHSCRMKQRDNK